MDESRLIDVSARWFRLLQRVYPADFRAEVGPAMVEAYVDRARAAWRRGGIVRIAALWIRALADSLVNGLAEHLRPAAPWGRSSRWSRDAQFVTRRLLRAPAFVAATVGTLTIGLGLFAVVYTAVEKILIEPLPYKHPGDLYFVWRDYGSLLDLTRGSVSGPDIAELQKGGGAIEDAVGLQQCFCGIFSLREGDEPIEIKVTVTSPNLFDVLGVEPALGRGFAPEEVGPGHRLVIVFTHELWSRLGADPALLGKQVRLNGQSYTVIGVLPPRFGFVRHEPLGAPQPADAYTTFNVNLAQMRPASAVYSTLIRARQGTPPETVNAAVDAVGRAIDTRDFNGRGLRLYPVGLKTDLVARIRPALVVLAAAGVVLALMLLVNLASVLLARAAEREHEFGVSRALGADHVAIMRAMLLEGGALGLLGGMLGTLAAIWGTRAVVAVAPLDLPRREAIAIDWTIAGVVVGVGALLGLLAAIVPAIWAARVSLSALLATSAVRGGGGQGHLRRGMVVAQVALSLVLLSSGALVMRSFEHLLRADPGFNPEGVLSVLVRSPPEFFPQFTDVNAFQERLQNAFAAIPGVLGASAASTLPLSASSSQMTIQIPGAPGNIGDAERDAVLVDVVSARPGYVEVMGMRLVAGHAFAQSRPAGVLEAIIDTNLARRFFPDGNALGAQIPYNNRSLTVVGVVDQARLYDVHQDGRPQMYIRADDWGYRPLYFAIRTARDPRAILPDVRAATRQTDPRVAVGNARTLEEIVGDTLRQQRTSATLIATFAAGALLLAAMGLFGVVSGSVTRRRHELAVRLALGADHRRVLRLVLREGALLVIIGALLGVPGIYIAGRLIRGVLVGISPNDPITLVAAALGLLLVTMATCYVPARRALGIDPAQLLRQ